jgi:predicted N-acyltransferase
MHVEWLRTIDDLRERDWDALTEDTDLFRCCDWLELTAASDPEMAAAPQYLMVLGDDSRPLAGTPVYVQTADAMPDPMVRVDLVQRQVLSPGRDWAADLMPGLVLGGWVPFDNRVLLGVGASRPVALAMALDELEDFARRSDAASMSFLYVDDSNADLRQELSRRGFVSATAPARGVINVSWDDFEGYLASLSQNRRSAARGDQRKLAEAGVSFEMVELTAADVPVFARLAYATGSRHEPETVEAEMARWFGALQRSDVPVMILRATLAGTLCGFTILVEWRGVLYSQHCGIDYELKKTLPVYFSLAFYEPIRYALRRGIRRIECSIGSDAVKSSRGCDILPSWTYVRACDPAVQADLTECFRLAARQEVRA